MAALSQLVNRATLVGMLVQPETVLGWHRELVRRKRGAFGHRRGPGRPCLDAEIQELILEMRKTTRGGAACESAASRSSSVIGSHRPRFASCCVGTGSGRHPVGQLVMVGPVIGSGATRSQPPEPPAPNEHKSCGSHRGLGSRPDSGPKVRFLMSPAMLWPSMRRSDCFSSLAVALEREASSGRPVNFSNSRSMARSSAAMSLFCRLRLDGSCELLLDFEEGISLRASPRSLGALYSSRSSMG